MVRQPGTTTTIRSVLLAILCGCVAPSCPLVAAAEAATPQARSEQDVRAVEQRLLAKADRSIQQHRKGDAALRVEDARGRPLENARVEIRQTGHEFLFGCILFDLVAQERPYQEQLYKRRFKELFNFAVFPFYWQRYEPRPGETMRDKLVGVLHWCRQNGITAKGHPLVWTNRSGVPLWLADRSRQERQRLMLGRVRREVAGFAGLIDIWDVVNEPVNTRAWDHVESGDYVQEPIPPIADYVDQAMRAARQANPQAHLILNEYNTIARREVRERFYQLVRELKRRGTPLSGLGIQAHEPRQHWYPPEEVWATFDRLASLGLPLHVTEFIPQSGGKPITGGWRQGRWTEQAQAEFAEQFYRLGFGHPAVVSINWWGFSDRQIWLTGGGLVTREYEPKPVYERLQRLLHQQWNTHVDGTTDAKGSLAFRGFYGPYSVRVTAPGKQPQSFDAQLRKGQANHWTFTVRD